MLSAIPEPKASFSIDNIKKILTEIRGSDENVEVLQKNYIEFYDTYPKLFRAAIDKTFPLTFLDVMLKNLEKLNKNECTVDEADKSVYGILQKEYIDPVTDNLTQPPT